MIVVIGSNIDKEKNVPEAIRQLREHPRFEVLRVSPTYASASVGGPPGAPDFHNVAVLLRTDLDPEQLRQETRAIELRMGRRRGPDVNEPRVIDLDLCYYGDLVSSADGRELPDPDATEQAYAAVPIARIVPGFRHPVTGETMTRIAARLTSG